MQELEPGKLTQAGDYDLFTCQIVSYRIHKENQKPVTIDIKPIVGSIEISESIFQKTIQGKIQVFDGNDIKTILPITGLEKVHLKFNTHKALQVLTLPKKQVKNFTYTKLIELTNW